MKTSGLTLLVNGANGIYVPQAFVENFDMAVWQGIKQEDIDILKAGPNHEWYWETWDSILINATHTDKEGNIWYLYQDGDLWAYCPELMDSEEYENFFGEPKPTED